MSVRTNTDITSVLAISGTTLGTPITSPVQSNGYGRGVKVSVQTTAASAGSFTVTVQGLINGIAITLLTSAAISTTGQITLTVYPGLTASANVIANDILPRQWQVTVTPTGFTGVVNIGASVIV